MRGVQPKLKKRIEVWSMMRLTGKRNLERSLCGPHTKEEKRSSTPLI
jgi:hypothetical protein